MIKQHSKLRKLWQKAKKIKKGNSMLVLDMRNKASQEFVEELLQCLKKGIRRTDIFEILESCDKADKAKPDPK